MNSGRFAGAHVVVVRGDPAAVAVSTSRVLDDLCTEIGISASERRNTVEHVEDLAAAIVAVTTPSMFGSARIVILDESVDRDGLTKLLAHRSSDAVTVVTYSGRTAPKAAPGLVVVAPPASRTARDRSQAVTAAAERVGVRLDRAATDALADRLGADVAGADAAVAALLTAAPDGVVTASLVADVVDTGAAANPFALIDSVEAGDVSSALDALERLSGPSGWVPVRTVAMLRNRFVSAWRISAGVAPPDGFAGEQLSRLARRLGPAAAHRCVTHVAGAEAAVKGGSGIDAYTAVEVCVARLARECRASRR